MKIFNYILRLLKYTKMSSDNSFIINIDRSWSTDTAIGIKGTIEIFKDDIENMEVTINNVTVPINSWHEIPRKEANCFPPKSIKKGFWVQIPRIAQHQAIFKLTQSNKVLIKSIKFKGSTPIPPVPVQYPTGDGIFDNFVKIVNDEHLHVLEIGSRIIPPKKNGLRSIFSQAGSYTGFDYHLDSNTDVVGDAHRLSSYFNGRKFDAVFSIAVFEHLAMPWVVAMEINKILNIGGISCHQTPFAWPAHERPWDFWRYSDEGLKVLFSNALGFETINAGMSNPLRMYFDKPIAGRERFPLVPCFGCSSILSKKTSELEPEKFRWNINLEEVLGSESHYPQINVQNRKSAN